MSAKVISNYILFIILTCTLLPACNTARKTQADKLTTDFSERFQLYARHLRWGHFRETTTFMTAEQAEAAKVDSLKERRITSVKPTAWVLDEEAGTMTGDVDIDYYVTDRGIVRSTTQRQVWQHNGNIWQLDNGLPKLP